MYLFFDVETSGLPLNYKAPVTDTSNWPRVVQLAYQLYDEQGVLLQETNRIVKPEGFIIPKEATAIHGITHEEALEKGLLLLDVIEEFLSYAQDAKLFIAHNADFDSKVLDAELLRNQYEPLLTTSCDCLCTMKSTTAVCKLPSPYGYKWPRLEELHEFLFKKSFQGAHNALVDVQITAKCFFELRKRKYL
ncbi:MAG: exonuclease domain-containing protein [Candidatus Woesearchaeota archaeon]